MASIYKRKKSPYWWIKWYNPETKDYDYTSSKIRITNNNKKLALKMAAEIEAAKTLNMLPPVYEYIYKQQPILSIAFKTYLEYKKSRKNEKLAPSSITNYTYSINHFIDACGDLPIDHYSDDHCGVFEKHLDVNEFSEHTQGIYTRQLKAIFNWFIKKDMITKNPIYVIRARKSDPLPIPYSEMQLLFNFLSRPQYSHILIFNILLLMTGLRSNELLNIRKKDINFEQEYFVVTNFKGKHDNVIKPLFKELKNLLIKLGIQKLKENDFVMLQHYKNYSGYKSAWRRAMTQYKKEFGKHYQMKQFRKNFATYLIDSGVDIYDVHQFVGHSDMKVLLQHYVGKNRNRVKNEINDKVKFIGGILPEDILTTLN
jgi:integrase